MICDLTCLTKLNYCSNPRLEEPVEAGDGFCFSWLLLYLDAHFLCFCWFMFHILSSALAVKIIEDRN